jgi:L-ascorbate metabolism protein UlaG (beta-lactamase superfamily)
MEIVWYGLSCFRLVERGMATLVCDPYDPSVGLPPLKLKADVVTVSHDAAAHNYVRAVRGYRRVIDGPGEYEVGGVFITGIRMTPRKGSGGNKGNTIYVFDFDGLTVAHLGDLSYVPDQAQIEDLGTVDIALIPVAGEEGMSASSAAEVISLIEPSLVLPMQYATGDEMPGLGSLASFLSEMGIGKAEPLPSLKTSKSSLSDETEVVVLEPAWKKAVD